MYKTSVKGNSGDDLIYYNIVINNPANLNGSPTPSIPLNFSETRTIPILDKPDDYLLSVIRFSLPGFNIPILIFPVIPNPLDATDINYSSLTVTFTYMNVNSPPVHLRWIPEPAIPVPTPIVAFTNQAYLYYAVYNYQTLIDIYNTAIVNAIDEFNTLNPGLLPDAIIDGPPYFQFDKPESRISLVALQQYFDQKDTPTASLSINYLGLRFFIGIPVINYYFNISNASGIDYTFIIENEYNNWYNPSFLPQPVTGTPLYLIMTQEFYALAYWLDLVTIVFSSGSIPVVGELVPTREISSNAQGNANSKPIITDFIPNIGESAGDFLSKYVYNPTSEYREVNLNSQVPLTTMDVRIQWQDANNNLYDILLFPNMSCSIKILFQKKSTRLL
jgi:hypothetical protein